jgi:uncharacterized protein YigE (DUF2233 family)
LPPTLDARRRAGLGPGLGVRMQFDQLKRREAFLKQRPRAELATQSGPMLVINGPVHPRFDRRSTSLKARNGVGVRADGKVIFAISRGEVSFDAFARLFRDGLHCPNALFLDGGSAASLYAPSLASLGNIVSLGPMLAVFERNRGAIRQ